MTRVPFGKYKNTLVCDLPDDYLHYMLSLPDFKQPFKNIFQAEVNRREKNLEVSESKIRKAYKEMAMKYHPDRGGSNTEMKVVNDFFEVLKRVCQ